jgi:uncharacterized coiled-coil protein SlyX
MSFESRIDRLETIALHHDDVLTRLVTLQEEQRDFNRDMLTLLNSIDDRLGAIERALRERPTNGSRP